MDRAFGGEIHCRATSLCSVERRRRETLLVATLCAASILLHVIEVRAQCTARDVLRNHLTSRAPSALTPPVPLSSADDLAVWKAVKVGTFANIFALLGALDAAGCSLGDAAAQIVARPAFTLSSTRMEVELVAVSVAELGFHSDAAALIDVYARARQLGFELAPAETALQLRLQYLDQPLGELVVGMEPIRTWAGEPVILAVANGGERLVVIGRDGRPDAQIPTTSRFVFVRPRVSASALATAAHGFDAAMSSVHH